MDNPLRHMQYDKLCDDILLIGFNTVLRFNVILSKPTQDNRRWYYHQEYTYNTNKYPEVKELSTLRRQFDFYLSIENIRQNDLGYKEFIQIRARDILYLREQLHEATRWFRDAKYSNLFAYNKDNRLIMLGRTEPIEIFNLSMDKYLKIEPTIITYNNNDRIGVRIYLSSESVFVDIDVDKLMELVYHIQSINMYESAQLLINYLQRPPLGTNDHRFDGSVSNADYNEDGYIEEKTPKRLIESKNDKKQKSFFDKIDGLK